MAIKANLAPADLHWRIDEKALARTALKKRAARNTRRQFDLMRMKRKRRIRQ